MIGCYISRQTDEEREKLTQIIRDLIGHTPESEDLQCLSPTGLAMSYTELRNKSFSMYCAQPEGCQAGAIISPGNRLFANGFGQSFLAAVHQSVTQGGWLCVPYWPEKVGRQRGFWTLSWLSEFLQSPVKESKDHGMAVFHRGDSLQQSDSVMTWYSHDFAALFLDYISQESLEMSLELLLHTFKDFLVNRPNSVPSYRETAWSDDNKIDLAAELDRFAGTMNYMVGGTNYKSAVLERIIGDHITDGRKLKILDMGGAAGFVNAELLLTMPRVEKAVTVDHLAYNLTLARRLFSYYRCSLAGRYFMEITPAQDYLYQESFDLVSFIGALLYVPREYVNVILQRSWDALNPGGVLVIHENIKSPSYKKDFDVMFTVEELEGYLEQFGEIEYYASTSAARLKPDQAGKKTLFRVIQKK